MSIFEAINDLFDVIYDFCPVRIFEVNALGNEIGKALMNS